MFTYLILEIISVLIGVVAIILFAIHLIKKPAIYKAVKQKGFYLPIIIFISATFIGFIANKTYAPNFAMPPFLHR